MNAKELQAYCESHGIPYQLRMVKGAELLCILDMTQLPMGMREGLNERGFNAAEYDAALATAKAVKEAEEAAAIQEGESTEDAPSPLRGHLPDGFPGKAAFEVEGYDTYAKVRAVRKVGTKVPGVGDATNAAVDEIFAGESK